MCYNCFDKISVKINKYLKLGAEMKNFLHDFSYTLKIRNYRDYNT